MWVIDFVYEYFGFNYHVEDCICFRPIQLHNAFKLPNGDFIRFWSLQALAPKFFNCNKFPHKLQQLYITVFTDRFLNALFVVFSSVINSPTSFNSCTSPYIQITFLLLSLLFNFNKLPRKLQELYHRRKQMGSVLFKN